MRLSTLLALVALVALYIWAMNVNRRPAPAPATGAAQVVDGDSLRIEGRMIRLKGIDAPEIEQMCRRGGEDYRCGRDTQQALRRLVRSGVVTCDGNEHDRFGRLLAICRIGDIEINAWLVREGLAVSFGDYLIEEAQARAASRGLWSGEFEMPRDYRARHPREDAGARPQSPPPAPVDTPLPPQRPVN